MPQQPTVTANQPTVNVIQPIPASATLYYFDTHGRGEMIRAIFRYYKIHYEDVRIRMDQWPAIKFDSKFEYAVLPVLEWKGQYISQSHAILYFLGKEFKCIPNDPMDEYEMNNVICCVSDLATAVGNIFFTSKTPEERNQRLGEHFSKTVPFYIERFENKLKIKSNSNFIAGSCISLADFAIAGMAIGIFALPDGTLIKKNICEKYPLFAKYVDGLLKLV